MALRAPLLLFVRLAAAPEFYALRAIFHEVLEAVENNQARFVVVARNADPILRNQIEGACVRHGVLMFHVPKQDELGNAAHRFPFPVVACAIVGAPRSEEYTQSWITMLTELSDLQVQLGYQPNV